MNATAIDTITNAFVDAMKTGAGALAQYSIPLLAIFALVSFYMQIGTLVAYGGGQVGDTLAATLLHCLKIGIFYWLLVNFIALAEAAFLTFLQWGIAPTGGGLSAATFMNPSAIIDLGFRAAAPLVQFMGNMGMWAKTFNPLTTLGFQLAYLAIILAFTGVALHLMMVIIEFYLAVLVAMVMIPFGVLNPVAFFAEFSIGWATGGLIRVLVTGAIVGIAIPLFDLVTFRTTPGGDPTFYSALIVAIVSGIFLILSWVIPGRAAAIAGRGVSLALHGGTIMAGAASGARGVLLFTHAIRGASSLLRRSI